MWKYLSVVINIFIFFVGMVLQRVVRISDLNNIEIDIIRYKYLDFKGNWEDIELYMN